MLSGVDAAGGDWKGKLKALGLNRKRRSPGTAPVMPRDRRKLDSGEAGETMAAGHLAGHGLRILARNERYRNGELDLVAEDGAVVVFVEVRRRRTAERGGPAESVTTRKRARVVRAARRWLVENPRFAGREIRFDVVAIQDEPFSLDWIRSAFDS
jgi:putative endonuclease